MKRPGVLRTAVIEVLAWLGVGLFVASIWADDPEFDANLWWTGVVLLTLSLVMSFSDHAARRGTNGKS